ncbi:MAG: PilZ domain-containing protein [Bradyrhizobium sp.]
MNVAPNRRNASRVSFANGIDVHIVAIDGTWNRKCTMMDVSETGARLALAGSVVGLSLKEFFLLLSSTGAAFRRCELAWVNGEQIGVNFLREVATQKRKSKVPVGQDSLEAGGSPGRQD